MLPFYAIRGNVVFLHDPPTYDKDHKPTGAFDASTGHKFKQKDACTPDNVLQEMGK